MKYGNESSLSRIIQNLKRFLDLKADKTEIPTSLSSLSSDSTHRQVTDTEKKTWNSKQSALNSQTAYSNKGSNSKVAKITTNSLGQVTNITEVDINITKSQVSDFPTSMPASDVYSWAKASTKPSYSWSEIGSRPTKVSQFTNDSGYITSSGSCAYATSAGNADKVDGVHVTWSGSLTSTSHLVAWESDGSALRDIQPSNIKLSQFNDDILSGKYLPLNHRDLS